MYDIFEQLLQEYGLTAYKVSQDTGITQATLSNWKSGRSIPKNDTMKKIANYFGVSIDYLLGNESERKENEFQAKDVTERELLLLCRKVGDVPEEEKQQIVNQFKSTIDLYLKAKGINNTKGD